MLVRIGSVKETFTLGVHNQHVVLDCMLLKLPEQHRAFLLEEQLSAAAYLEAYKDVSHLLLGQSVSKAL